MNHLKYQIVGILALFALLVLLPLVARATILFSNDFEAGTFNGFITCANWSYDPAKCSSGFPSIPTVDARAIVTSPVRAGAKAVQTIARPNWTNCYLFNQGPFSNNPACDRSEFETATANNHTGNDRWYGFSVNIDPSTVYAQSADPNGPLIFQLHENSGPAGCPNPAGPHVGIYFTYGGRWKAFTRANANTCSFSDTVNLYDVGSWTKGVWTDFVIHLKSSYTSSGVTQIWKDGVLLVNVTGPNDYNSTDTTESTKWGVYQSWWAAQAPPAGEQIVINHDSIKVGDASSSYAEVAPQTQLAPPTNLTILTEQ